jgi:hypothetical protein
VKRNSTYQPKNKSDGDGKASSSDSDGDALVVFATCVSRDNEWILDTAASFHQLNYSTKFSLWQVKMRAILAQTLDLDDALDCFGKKPVGSWT